MIGGATWHEPGTQWVHERCGCGRHFWQESSQGLCVLPIRVGNHPPKHIPDATKRRIAEARR